MKKDALFEFGHLPILKEKMTAKHLFDGFPQFNIMGVVLCLFCSQIRTVTFC